MQYVRKTISIPESVLERITGQIEGSENSLSEFMTRAAINQLEKEYSDFEVRDIYEGEIANAAED